MISDSRCSPSFRGRNRWEQRNLVEIRSRGILKSEEEIRLRCARGKGCPERWLLADASPPTWLAEVLRLECSTRPYFQLRLKADSGVQSRAAILSLDLPH